MTQDYELSDDVVRELVISGIGFANQVGLGQYLPTTEKEANKAVGGWFAAHDAQIRAEALQITDEERDVALTCFIDAESNSSDSWFAMKQAFKAVAEHRKGQKQ
ncbi:hypothetical protein [Bifidobacterium aquikefiri]|uniref:hypothetical protein n=1 Tax=Bifidobacterium aquikefiri TaxID=1653207 RepID=UPI0039ECE506